MSMTENKTINGWTFEETIQTTENLMEVENNVFKWDVLRHLRDFAESFKDELEQYRAIGTVEEFKALKGLTVTQNDIDAFNAYIYDCMDGVAFGNTDWNRSLSLALKCMELHKV
jgi:hypothetical protein